MKHFFFRFVQQLRQSVLNILFWLDFKRYVINLTNYSRDRSMQENSVCRFCRAKCLGSRANTFEIMSLFARAITVLLKRPIWKFIIRSVNRKKKMSSQKNTPCFFAKRAGFISGKGFSVTEGRTSAIRKGSACTKLRSLKLCRHRSFFSYYNHLSMGTEWHYLIFFDLSWPSKHIYLEDNK